MVKLVKCLLCKHRDLSSSPSAYFKMLGVGVCTCNPSTGEVETGDLWNLLVTQPNLVSKPWSQ